MAAHNDRGHLVVADGRSAVATAVFGGVARVVAATSWSRSAATRAGIGVSHARRTVCGYVGLVSRLIRRVSRSIRRASDSIGPVSCSIQRVSGLAGAVSRQRRRVRPKKPNVRFKFWNVTGSWVPATWQRRPVTAREGGVTASRELVRLKEWDVSA